MTSQYILGLTSVTAKFFLSLYIILLCYVQNIFLNIFFQSLYDSLMLYAKDFQGLPNVVANIIYHLYVNGFSYLFNEDFYLMFFTSALF